MRYLFKTNCKELPIEVNSIYNGISNYSLRWGFKTGEQDWCMTCVEYEGLVKAKTVAEKIYGGDWVANDVVMYKNTGLMNYKPDLVGQINIEVKSYINGATTYDRADKPRGYYNDYRHPQEPGFVPLEVRQINKYREVGSRLWLVFFNCVKNKYYPTGCQILNVDFEWLEDNCERYRQKICTSTDGRVGYYYTLRYDKVPDEWYVYNKKW